MSSSSALIVAGPNGTGPAADDLAAALVDAGFEVARTSVEELAGYAGEHDAPDVLLAPASIGAQRIALAGARFAGDGRVAVPVVFPDGDDEQLEQCVEAGFDYVAPPYRPGLLRGRLATGGERGQRGGRVLALQETAATDSVREYERELGIAREIQAGFLPDELPTHPDWQLATAFRPAKQVAGDFYDAFELVHGRRLGLIVADVCDKGVGAALFMALIRTLLRHTAQQTDVMGMLDDDLTAAVDGAARDGVNLLPMPAGAGPLMQAVVGTNRYLTTTHLRQNYFATMFFGVLDPVTGALIYINGGHNPPLLSPAAGGDCRKLEPTGPAVGMLPQSEFAVGRTVIAPGDRLFIYTDGVVEARDPDGTFFGLDRLERLIGGTGPDLDADDVVKLVDDAVREYTGPAEQFDDITMFAVRHLGPPPPD